MSSHSRSSSDSDRISIKDILPIFLQDFIKDFSFSDIYQYLRQEGIFNDEDLGRISALSDEKKQTILLFFILTDKPELIERFLNILRIDYSWLSDKVLNYHNTISNKELTQYILALQELRSLFPKHTDFNVHRLNYFFTIREKLKKLQKLNYLVVHGDLGRGKKWLSLDVCCDFSVMKRMGFKIFWIDVHNCDKEERDLEKLQRLKILLDNSTISKKAGDYEGIGNKILELQQDIRSILKGDEYKNCLLVLSNVRNRKTIQTFKLGCKILIITRIKDFTRHISSSLYKSVYIKEGFTQSECIDLFEKILKIPKERFPENSNDLFEQCKEHPFMSNIIAQNIKGQSNSEWNRWIKNLNDSCIDDEKISNMIHLSLNFLKPEELKLFKTLAIFKYAIKIPTKVLAGLWNKPDHETILILHKFDKFSLINFDNDFCTIHFSYYSYLKKCDDIDRRELNRDLIKSYNIEIALNNRYELDLIELPNDEYFHYYIGYHLREAGMTEYFSKFYLDFGFLGQKLRATGLPNTIGDLKYFRNEITNNESYKEKLLEGLLEFLPNIEEMIFRSRDTNLLQYGLMGDGVVHEEALKQAKQFPDKIWFFDGESTYASIYASSKNIDIMGKFKAISDITNKISSRGHFHRRRQMISLPGKPKLLKLIEPDTCLIVADEIDKPTMLLADLSLGYNTEPTKFVGHEKDIIQIDSFGQNLFIISLDLVGEIRIWSIVDERRRSITRKQSSRLRVNHIDFANARMRKKECIQLITKSGDRQQIQHFHIDNYTDPSNIYLRIVLTNGNICNYIWVEKLKKFEPEIMEILKTRIPNIQFMLKIFEFYVVIDNMGNLKPFHIRDSSCRAISFRWPNDTNAPIRLHYFNKECERIVIFVFGMKIIQVNFAMQKFEFLKGDLKILYECPDRRSAITCSCLSDDNRYLIIGTKQGIIVFDTIEKSEVLRNSISESIVCVDIYSLDDNIYKYVIVSGSEGRKVLNIFGIKLNSNESITWANSIGTLGKETNLNPQFEPNAWLVGKQLFDVNFYDNSSSLVALDSKNRVHQMTIENKNWSLMVPTNINCKITAITATLNDDYYYGCENGRIYNPQEDELQTNLFTKSITFLKLINNNLLVASSSATNDCIVYHCTDNKFFKYKFDVANAGKLFNKFLILWDKKCNIMILDIRDRDNIKINHNISDIKGLFNSENRILGGSDLQSNVFILGTIHSQVYVYKFFDNDDFTKRFAMLERDEKIEITCISISPDTNYCAIGLKTGLIEIYKIDTKLELLRELYSHKSQIYAMKFSPWTDLNTPLILASSSEQICFWDINYVINNPISANNFNAKDRRRHSSRFNSTSSTSNLNLDKQYTIQSTEITSSTTARKRYYSDSTSPSRLDREYWLSSTTNIISSNPWLNKKGPSNKPELLSCIKYAGTKAEKFYANKKFTKFITIDDEGEYYLLNVQNIEGNDNIIIINNNGNGNGNIDNNNADIFIKSTPNKYNNVSHLKTNGKISTTIQKLTENGNGSGIIRSQNGNHNHIIYNNNNIDDDDNDNVII